MLSFLRRTDPHKAFADALAGKELPAFPALLWDVLERLRDPHSSLDGTAERISMDPGLSVKLLRTVNSAAYGLRSCVHSVSHAVALLGRRHVESIVLALAVQKALPEGPHQSFDATDYWRGASARATVARHVAQLVCPRQAGFNFTAALLQDMAVPLLAHHGPKNYTELLTAAREDGEDLLSLERAEFGWNHALVGAWMGGRWEFPDDLVLAITDHHEAPCPTSTDYAPARIVAGLEEVEGDLDWLVSTMQDSFEVAPDVVRHAIQTARTEADDLARIILG